tara:strand:- start:234 stop:566 length:333 start_codon:yes stop_codon:yes gene_type:complete
MTTSGLNNTKPSKLYDTDIIRKEGETTEEWIGRMRKWSGQYRRIYGKLYYRIYIKEIYKKEDLDLYIKMTNKPPPTQASANDTSKPKKLYRGKGDVSFKVERKYIKLDFT